MSGTRDIAVAELEELWQRGPDPGQARDLPPAWTAFAVLALLLDGAPVSERALAEGPGPTGTQDERDLGALVVAWAGGDDSALARLRPSGDRVAALTAYVLVARVELALARGRLGPAESLLEEAAKREAAEAFPAAAAVALSRLRVRASAARAERDPSAGRGRRLLTSLSAHERICLAEGYAEEASGAAFVTAIVMLVIGNEREARGRLATLSAQESLITGPAAGVVLARLLPDSQSRQLLLSAARQCAAAGDWPRFTFVMAALARSAEERGAFAEAVLLLSTGAAQLEAFKTGSGLALYERRRELAARLGPEAYEAACEAAAVRVQPD